jgi:hypothetical protein
MLFLGVCWLRSWTIHLPIRVGFYLGHNFFVAAATSKVSCFILGFLNKLKSARTTTPEKILLLFS